MNYNNMIEFELDNSWKFDLVMHLRFDMMWGAPLNHAADFFVQKQKVFVHSMYFKNVPDTWAIIPRQFTDAYFDIESFISPGVMCLGGPNFDKDWVWTVTPRELLSLVKAALCSDEGDSK